MVHNHTVTYEDSKLVERTDVCCRKLRVPTSSPRLTPGYRLWWFLSARSPRRTHTPTHFSTSSVLSSVASGYWETCGLTESKQNDFCIKMGSNESHFNVSVGSDGQSHKTVSTNHNLFEERAEAVSNRGPSAYQPNSLLLGQTGSHLSSVIVYH